MLTSLKMSSLSFFRTATRSCHLISRKECHPSATCGVLAVSTLKKCMISTRCCTLGSAELNGSQDQQDRRIGFSQAEQRNLIRKKPQQPQDSHVLNIAIIGSPNAGKSTLANRLLGWKIAPVSEKVHTTRRKTLGILTEGKVQLVFLDTPGMIENATLKRHQLEPSLLMDPHSSLFKADVIVVLVDVSTTWGRQRLDTEVLKALHFHHKKKAILVLNKVDLLKSKSKLLRTTRLLTAGMVGGQQNSFRRKELEPKLDMETLFRKMADEQKEESVPDDGIGFETSIMQAGDIPEDVSTDTWRQYSQRLRAIQYHLHDKDVKGWPHFDRVFMVSAKEGDGVWGVKNYLLDEAKPGDWQYSGELITPQPTMELARQCVWEQCLNYLPKEIPYRVRVEVELWDIDDDGMLRTSFNIICSGSRHMAHVLGKDGETVKKIARGAKQALLDTFRRDLSFKLFVKSKGSASSI